MAFDVCSYLIVLQTEKYGAQKTCTLDAGVSETLRVSPVPKRLRMVVPGRGTWTERWGTAINLHFDGNWMPLLVRCNLHRTVLGFRLQVLRRPSADWVRKCN